MELNECYKCFGGNYEAVKERIPNDTIIQKFLMKFLEEPSYDLLEASLQENNYEEAFRAAHSLKGVSANLGFDRLEVSAGNLTEYLRGKKTQQIDKAQCRHCMEQVTKDYLEVVAAIRLLDGLIS